jgi:hypothetical protein
MQAAAIGKRPSAVFHFQDGWAGQNEFTLILFNVRQSTMEEDDEIRTKHNTAPEGDRTEEGEHRDGNR